MQLEKEGKMQNPYSQYKRNQGSKPKGKSVESKKPPRQRPIPRFQSKVKSRQARLSLSWVVGSLAGLVVSFYAFAYTDDFIEIFSRIQVGFSSSLAAESENSSAEEGKNDPEKSNLPVGSASELKADADQLTMKNANIYKALKDKRRELEKKERRLAQLEEDLQKQKEEIEKQLKEMQEMRTNISTKLDRKVAADQESIDKLVGVYSNMKPKNAALIISQIDDDLAVKVLGKMKKQSAAEILNFVEPKKAQFLSEKFTGLKQ